MNTNIATRTLATLCIATCALILTGSVDQYPQSVGRLPVSVHSAAAHGMTVPGALRIKTAQVAD
jgi:hypothetical protein